jgi:hypothetical protein
MTPKIEVVKEIRFAVVMYGGVSLAIYINGVAQELMRMARVTALNSEAADFRFKCGTNTRSTGNCPQVNIQGYFPLVKNIKENCQ